MIKTLDRYIFLELIEPFLFGLGAFTAILSCSMILFELVRAVVIHGMPLLTALQIFLYRLPGVAVFIFPMATLLGALLAFARLSHDSEIIAFRASGISLVRLMAAVVFMGFLISVVSLSFSEIVVPESNKAAKDLLIVTTAKRAPKLQKNILVPELEGGVLRRIYYAETFRGDVMENVIVQEFSQGKLAQIVTAKEAVWLAGKKQWRFNNGTIYIISETGEYKHLIKYEEQNLSIKYSPADFNVGDKNPDEMTIAQLKEFIDLKRKMGNDVKELEIQLNLKTAIPFASLVFAMLGAPLGISPRRASGSIGLGISIIVIFVYYILTFISMAVGQLGLISPFLSAWLPNVLTGIGSWYVLARVGSR